MAGPAGLHPAVRPCAGSCQLGAFSQQYAAAVGGGPAHGGEIRQHPAAQGHSVHCAGHRRAAMHPVPPHGAAGCVRYRVHADHVVLAGGLFRRHPGHYAAGGGAVLRPAGVRYHLCAR